MAWGDQNIISTDEVRQFFTPFLDHSDMEDAQILSKIDAVEEYVSTVYLDGSYSGNARIPCLLLVSAKIMREPTIANSDTYQNVKEIGDVKFFSTDDVQSPYQQARTWEDMAEDMLQKIRDEKGYTVKLADWE